MKELTININEQETGFGKNGPESLKRGIDLGNGIILPYPGQLWEPPMWREYLWNSGVFKGMRIGSTSNIDKGSSRTEDEILAHITQDLIPTIRNRSNVNTLENDLSEIYEAYPEVKVIVKPEIEKTFQGGGNGDGETMPIFAFVFFIIGLLWGIAIGVLIGRATKKNG